MKYIIWGAGQRGKRALHILGDERVAFFVDADSNKAGTFYNGKEIKGIDACNGDNIILITPLEAEEEIVRILKDKGIKNYFLFSECPWVIDWRETEEDLGEEYNLQYDFKSCALLGFGWFALYLYDFLKQKEVEVCLVDQNEIPWEMKGSLEGEYKFKSLDEVTGHVEVILNLTDDNLTRLDGEDAKVLSIYDYLEESMVFHNEEILKFKGLHQGERCFIVGTGPSLTVNDLNMLAYNNEKCFSVNRIYKIFPKTMWRPDYYVAVDTCMIEDLAKEIAELPLEYKFIPSKPKLYWMQDGLNTSVKINRIRGEYSDKNIRFSQNAERCIYNGETVVYICMQLAVYMGFKEIYLLGIDFHYSADVYDTSNHFEGYHNYYKEIRAAQFNAERQLIAYKKAKEAAEACGARIVNATRGGMLEVFERKSFDAIIS